MVVPVHAAGEFLEGAAWISQERLLEAIAFLQMFRILVADIETATHYARTVAELRGRGLLQGLSKPDLWIAASAMAHGAELVTLNTKHFTPIPALRLRTY